MKNPKVGERVAFTSADGVRRKGKLLESDGTDIWVKVGKGFDFLVYAASQKDARRLVPKKRERTYTEAEIERAFARALHVTGSACFESLQRFLREGNGR